MFKKAVIVLLLLITPFVQARAVLVCSMMNDVVVEHCSCPDHPEHAATTRDDAPEAACCDVVFEVSDKAFAGIGTDLPTLKRVSHDAPDAVTLAASAVVAPTFVVTARLLPPPTDALGISQSRLYLRTARLRL